MNNNLEGNPLAKRCIEKCWQLEKEAAGELQTTAVIAAGAVLSLVLQVPKADLPYVEHDANNIHKVIDFMIEAHRKQFAEAGNCSRCHKPIQQFTPPTGGMTAGYYVVAGWKEFCNEGEIYVCDNCMWEDPRYIKVYGEIKAHFTRIVENDPL